MATVMNWRRAAQALSAGALILGSTAGALAQNGRSNRNTPIAPDAPLAERLLQRGKTKDWVMTVDIYYPGLKLDYPPVDRYGIVRPGFVVPGQGGTMAEWNRMAQQAAMGVKFDTAAMVLEIPENTSSHSMSMGTFSSSITVDGRELAATPQWTSGYQSGERLARWDIRNVDGRRLTLHVEIPVTCWETIFNEPEGVKVNWPKGEWPAVAKSALEPVYLVEWRDTEQEIADNKAQLDTLVKGWLNGRDPKSMQPVMLAKELAGRVMEYCNTGDGDSVYGTSPGTFLGLQTRTVGEVINSKRCYTLDVPVFLGAVYRHVGLPARTVYGFDMSEEKGDKGAGGRSKVSAWTEFALLDAAKNEVVWVPVDVINLRRAGSRMQKLDRQWKYFGSNDNLTYMIPIGFHAHPPTGVVVRSLPAFWGWLCTPETPPYPHSLKIDAMGQSSRDKQKNEQERNKTKPKTP